MPIEYYALLRGWSHFHFKSLAFTLTLYYASMRHVAQRAYEMPLMSALRPMPIRLCHALHFLPVATFSIPCLSAYNALFVSFWRMRFPPTATSIFLPIFQPTFSALMLGFLFRTPPCLAIYFTVLYCFRLSPRLMFFLRLGVYDSLGHYISRAFRCRCR